MSRLVGAALVHALTASGAVLALLALVAAHARRLANDVRLARRRADRRCRRRPARAARRRSRRAAALQRRASRSDRRLSHLCGGSRLRLQPVRPVAGSRPACLPASRSCLSSLFHIADQESKTKDGYFVGFPAIWNVVCLYLFVLGPPPYRLARHRRVFRRADLRADPRSASLPRRRVRSFTWLVTVLWTVGRHRCRRQSFSVAALGAGAARGDGCPISPA